MRKTLLEIVQSVLNSMDSDNVSNINDTIESAQVAQIAEEVYMELMSYKDWDHLYEWRQLEAVSDLTRPNFLKIPDNVSRVEMFKYNTTEVGELNTTYTQVKYLKPDEFVNIVHQRNSSDTNVDTVDNGNGVLMFIINNKQPEYWTSFDDTYIVTDSYQYAADTTLVQSKSSAWCRVNPTWTANNTFVPDMPSEFFPAYIAEVKSTCHAYLKQQLSQKDEQKARRGLAHARRKERFDRGSNRHDYGRK
jgi:hypothetical protein